MFVNKSSGFDWFAVRVKSNRERVTSAALEARGYDVFLPEYQRAGRPRADRTPLFPGYVFCRFDPADRLPVLIIPGVLHIVGVGKTPLPVDPIELESLKVLLKTGLPLNPAESFTVGDTVRIQEGPLAGALGVIVGQKSQRLLVSVTLLQRSVSVALEKEWIRHVAPGKDAAGLGLTAPALACG